jgi:hypothetical protein
MNRGQLEGGSTNPVGQGRAVDLEALADPDLGLAIERQVIGILGDDTCPNPLAASVCTMRLQPSPMNGGSKHRLLRFVVHICIIFGFLDTRQLYGGPSEQSQLFFKPRCHGRKHSVNQKID